LGLTGYVLNDPAGVLIEIEGQPKQVERFAADLLQSPPPLSVVTSIETEFLQPRGSSAFNIVASGEGEERSAPISADAAACSDCVAEISDPAQRRFRYAFTNCTNCGPRFTIATGIPYDRANTTMRGFRMCAECLAEYEDPNDRRFHAQPIACPACGPQLELILGDGNKAAGDPLRVAGRLLQDGAVVALKGLGGYHLACDATNESAVTRLRERKAREEKPLAVMVPSLDRARKLVQVSPGAEELLLSPAAPIVLLPKIEVTSLARAIAPGNRSLGMMLPYTPLHHLLLAEVGAPVVLTSGNVSEEPIAFRDEEARTKLKDIADAFLVHDRPIEMRCDDSVVRVDNERSYPIRRARGYAPAPLLVEERFHRPVLAAGPELKHTFCIGVGDRAIISHHIGDLENFDTMQAFVSAVDHFIRIFSVEPEVVAYDLHPEYFATKWALGLDVSMKIGVQHHHAHIASCLADNARHGPVIGVALDGTGFGDDGTIWGCEVFSCDAASYERLFHLRYIPLPGAAAAIREPWRVGAVYLDAAFGDAASGLDLPFVSRTRERWRPVLQMSHHQINSPLASSGGRLFDAAAAICGLRDRVSYEGQAAVELEQVADPSEDAAYECDLAGEEIDGVALVAALAEDLCAGRPVAQAAALFHNGLADGLAHACEVARDRGAPSTVALSGGSFQNVLLTRRLRDQLAAAGFEVLVHHRIPSNDGGISLGQAVVANARIGSPTG
jgi:hydrogenase maturation protein HypF